MRICSLLQESVSIICSRVFTFLLKSIKVIEPVFWSWKSKFWLWETLFVMLRSQKELLAQTQPDLSTHKKTYPEYANGMNKLLVPPVKREISDAI